MGNPSSAPMDLDEVEVPGAFPGEPPPLQSPPAVTINQPEDVDPTIHPCRAQKQPTHFHDILSETPVPAPLKPWLPTVYLIVTNPLMTTLNTFGIFQKYLFHPLYDPDSAVDPTELSNLSPCIPPNMSVWQLVRWMNTRSHSKSEGKVNCLVNEVLKAPDFHVEDLDNFNAHRAHSHLDTVKKRAIPQAMISRLPLSPSRYQQGNGMTQGHLTCTLCPVYVFATF